MLSIKPIRHPIRQTLLDIFTLTVLLAGFYAIWIGSHALFTPDEGRYSEVAREMIVNKDYLTPRLNGVVFYDKPILYYWLQASAIYLFGIKEWSLRFWPVLAGVLGCIITYLVGRVTFNRRTGIVAAIILASCPVYYGAAHYANLDLEVAVLISNALLFFLLATKVQTDLSRLLSMSAAYLFAGLAVLTKGLIGIAFPVMIIGSWILLLNRWHFLKKMHLLSGFIIFCAVTLPWYLLIQKAHPEFFYFFFLKQQISRFLTTDYFNNRTPGWFYFPIVIAGIFPWCIFLLQALTKNIKSVLKNRQAHSSELFLLLWLVIVFAFFSFPKSKTIGYIIPVFPALALLLAHYISCYWDQFKAKGITLGWSLFLILNLGIVVTCLALPSFHSIEINPHLFPYLKITAGIFAMAIGATIFILKKNKVSLLFTALTLTSASFLLVIAASSTVINEKTIKPLTNQIKSQLQPDDEIISYFKYFQDLPIYLERRITIVTNWNAPDIHLNDNWRRELWYGRPFQETADWLINDEAFWQRWDSHKRLFIFTDVSQLEGLQKKSKTEVFKIAQHNQTILVSNHPFSPKKDLPIATHNKIGT